MLKRILTVFIVLFLLTGAALAETQVYDRRSGEEPSVFDENAELMEIIFPHIHGCNGAVIRQGDTVIVIDSCTYGQYHELKAVLDKLGVTKIDLCINTHPDNDHISGFLNIVSQYEVGAFLTGFDKKDYREELQNYMYRRAQDNGVEWRRMTNGETLTFGDLTLRFVQREGKNWEINNCSLQVLVSYKGRTAYFPGDIQMACQKELAKADNPDDISAELINWPHHGYKQMQEPFLEKVNALMYVITSGASTAKDSTKQLKDKGLKDRGFITEKGALRFATDGSAWQIEYFK